MIQSLVPLYRALADPTRLKLLALIHQEPQCVEGLVHGIGASQPKVSRHLAYLRRAGLVETNRRGRRVYYKVARFSDPFVRRQLRDLLHQLNQLPRIRSDRRRMAAQSSC